MKNGIFSLMAAGALLSNVAVAQEDTAKFYVGAGYGVLTVPNDDETKFSDAHNGSLQFGYVISENFAIEAQYSKSVKTASAKAVVEGLDISDAWWQAILPLNPGVTLSDLQQWFPFAVADAAMDVEADIETTAIYGVYRSSGDLYVKAKAGYLSAKTKITATIKSADVYVSNPGSEPIEFTTKSGEEIFDDFGLNKAADVSSTESDFSAGLGVGYKFNPSLFSELEYTKLSDEFDFYSLSINYAF
jgi:hypothetical protein